ncbi:esterase-like activity of phytase family protein [Streptomyces sp. KM273126]|uniref:caspase, EACC1-associated type n=1 Tax=Streptomyces sp. KM273126 TaxID=2545247 RepID=UPI00103D7446|nr:esterase-like activity of phytase family protein [Streptomyces sp. KM273126]MBA2808532.1 esterase-like activity of phytase family protein [Streptomyces sp. KM273126]
MTEPVVPAASSPDSADSTAARTPGAPQRLDPARSVCLLIGVDAYSGPAHDGLEKLNSVKHNLAGLRKVFLDQDIGGFPEGRVITLPNPAEAPEIMDAVEEAGARAEDTLIVYYAGHGLLGTDQRLYLTLPKSRLRRPAGWVDTRHLRGAIEKSSARRVVLILDCCFSGKWIRDEGESYSAPDSAELALSTLTQLDAGTYALTSTAHNRLSHAPDPDKCSAFTGALVDVLSKGDTGGGEVLTLGEVFRLVRKKMSTLKLTEPQEARAQDENGLSGLGFVRNAAKRPVPEHTPTPAGVPALPPGRLRRRLLMALASGLAAGVAIGLAAPPAWDRLRPPTAARGDCSSRAALLDHSDALDKKEVDNEKVVGLSGLAFAPSRYGRAYAITDNETGRIFPIDIGTPEALRPQAGRATTLRKANGSEFGPWFDGEALAVEKGGRTALVASETGPAIRRFNLDSGHQVGPELPLPKSFQIWPDGGAMAGRTIESLALTPSGKYLYVGLESPLAQDGDDRGTNLLRIQRYTGTPGGAYTPDHQYAYRTAEGLSLVELVAVDDNRLLALERQYSAGLGNAIRVKDVTLGPEARDVTGKKSLYDMPSDESLTSTLLFDLAECPAGSPGEVAVKGTQTNPLLGNVEGMALGGTLSDGPYRGRRSLLMVVDDNDNAQQITRFYSVAVRL